MFLFKIYVHGDGSGLALTPYDLKKCNEKKKKNLNMIKKRKQFNNNPKMRNLNFFTCKKHNAVT
jgi:hypothetical protein